MASAKRIIQLGAKSAICFSKSGGINAASMRRPCPANFYRSFCSNSSAHQFRSPQISPEGERFYLVDTLSLVKSLEEQGVPRKHAEAITSVMTQVLDESLETMSQNLVSISEMQNILMAHEAKFSKFKSEVQCCLDQHHLLQLEFKKLQLDIEKLRSEIPEVTTGQHPDFNLETWHNAEDLANLTSKLKWEIQEEWAREEEANAEASYHRAKMIGAAASGIALICVTKSYFYLRGKSL